MFLVQACHAEQECHSTTLSGGTCLLGSDWQAARHWLSPQGKWLSSNHLIQTGWLDRRWSRCARRFWVDLDGWWRHSGHLPSQQANQVHAIFSNWAFVWIGWPCCCTWCGGSSKQSFQGSALVQKWDHGCEQLQHVECLWKNANEPLQALQFPRGKWTFWSSLAGTVCGGRRPPGVRLLIAEGKSPHPPRYHRGVFPVCPSPECRGV